MIEKDNLSPAFGIVLLAAGASSRLGKPKQLLQFQGQSFIQCMCNVALQSTASSIVVVLGSNAVELEKQIPRGRIQVAYNKEWEEGIASSIRQGVNNLVNYDPNTTGFILMLCDQPYVTSRLVNDLLLAHQTSGKRIITCSYADTFGPPTFFHRDLFPELLTLKGDVGARHILKNHSNEVEAINFPEGQLDIDTQEEYEEFSKQNSES